MNRISKKTPKGSILTDGSIHVRYLGYGQDHFVGMILTGPSALTIATLPTRSFRVNPVYIQSNPERVFLTSDTHFGHASIIKYDTNPYNQDGNEVVIDSIEMRDAIVLGQIAAKLSPGDTLYHLGDVAFSRKSLLAFIEATLNFSVVLVRGNHDDSLAWRYREAFSGAHEATYVRLGGHSMYLSHYGHRVWRNSNHGSFHFHGHSHGALPSIGRSLDVGVHCNNYSPVSCADAIKRLQEMPVTNHH